MAVRFRIIREKKDLTQQKVAEKLGKNVIQTQIISILNSVYGVFKVELETPSDIDIIESEWANLVDFNIEVGGYADE